MLLSGLRFSFFGLLAWISTVASAQSPAQCLGDRVAMEQSSAWLNALTAVPTPPFVPLISRGEARFVSTASLLSEVTSLAPRSVILNDIEELRFLPYTLAGTPLVLILKQVSDFTDEKSRKVVSVARTLNVSISLVWLDDSQVPSELSEAIEATKGQIIRRNELTRAVLEKFCPAS